MNEFGPQVLIWSKCFDKAVGLAPRTWAIRASLNVLGAVPPFMGMSGTSFFSDVGGKTVAAESTASTRVSNAAGVGKI
jgi:hypothetical protein